MFESKFNKAAKIVREKSAGDDLNFLDVLKRRTLSFSDNHYVPDKNILLSRRQSMMAVLSGPKLKLRVDSPQGKLSSVPSVNTSNVLTSSFFQSESRII